MSKAKGTALIGAVKALRGQKDEARRLLPERLHHYLGERISVTAWYPEEDLIGLIRALLELLPGDRDQNLEVMGIATARSQGEGVYAHLFEENASSASTYALWSSMHDTGNLKMTRAGHNVVTFELRDYASPSPEMCAIVGVYIREGLRMAGRVAKLESTACVLDGADACIWRATWED